MWTPHDAYRGFISMKLRRDRTRITVFYKSTTSMGATTTPAFSLLKQRDISSPRAR